MKERATDNYKASKQARSVVFYALFDLQYYIEKL